jgi:DNA polymerase delta subunit 2
VQERFGTELVRGPAGQVTRVVCVPSFSRTQEAVLLELHTLEAKPIKFAGYMAPEGSN